MKGCSLRKEVKERKNGKVSRSKENLVTSELWLFMRVKRWPKGIISRENCDIAGVGCNVYSLNVTRVKQQQHLTGIDHWDLVVRKNYPQMIQDKVELLSFMNNEKKKPQLSTHF